MHWGDAWDIVVAPERMGAMAKSARGSGKRGSKWQREHRPLSMGVLGQGAFAGGTVRRRDGEYYVRYISASAAQKNYTCPGCYLPVPVGTAHVVAWRADSIFGEEQAAADRRHWHSHCWRIG